MTGPSLNYGVPQQLLDQYGPQSQMYQDELAAFNSSRDGFLSQITSAMAQQHGFDVHLTKPAQADLLLERVGELMAKGRANA